MYIIQERLSGDYLVISAGNILTLSPVKVKWYTSYTDDMESVTMFTSCYDAVNLLTNLNKFGKIKGVFDIKSKTHGKVVDTFDTDC